MIRWWTAVGLTGVASIYCIATDNRWFYRNIVMRASRVFFDVETAHVMAIRLAKLGILHRCSESDDKILNTKLWGKDFSNPIGLAAGFDKDAVACYNLFDVGFGFIEVGSITPLPQEGNPKPRVFRLLPDQGVINRYGFNSCGHADAAGRLKLWESKRDHYPGKVLGVNLGKNKTSEDTFSDYQKGVLTLGDYVDYIVINVSSPNTPGLRRMQEKQKLMDLLSKLLDVRNELKNKPPLLVKVSPDLSQQEKEDVAAVVCSDMAKVDGLIVSNTTLQRPSSLQGIHRSEKGGLSGQPLKELSTQSISDFYKLTEGKVPIIGVGGVASGQDAYEKILAGASLVQVYTALVYEGPVVIKYIKQDLAQLLRQNGFSSAQEAVGRKHN